ncbi:hypothetical protein S40288_06571 [Stachybotrys chartarum IBT 40288]|nr:hypothetical protein S40288_06571 [Stachybotrys chartarum IBT 40288]
MPPSGQNTLDAWLSRSAAPSSTTARKDEPRSPSTGTITRITQRGNPHARKNDTRRSAGLAAVASETRSVLPGILKDLPNIRAANSESFHISTLPRLRAVDCPKRTPSGKTPITVVNDDSFNAAIALAASKGPTAGRVVVLNMASHVSPGGGWLKGARAQEEALCYRSSLALSLHRRFYPFRERMGLYTPDVVVIRSDMASGHQLLVPDTAPQHLPVFSVLSIAALRGPQTREIQERTLDGRVDERSVYAKPAERDLTKDKMRVCLRMAAQRNHGLLVLGALGCGVFKNPREDVAQCWLEVLREAEFQGGWWDEVWFAVYDTRNEGNFEAFDNILGGVEV